MAVWCECDLQLNSIAVSNVKCAHRKHRGFSVRNDLSKAVNLEIFTVTQLCLVFSVNGTHRCANLVGITASVLRVRGGVNTRLKSECATAVLVHTRFVDVICEALERCWEDCTSDLDVFYACVPPTCHPSVRIAFSLKWPVVWVCLCKCQIALFFIVTRQILENNYTDWMCA